MRAERSRAWPDIQNGKCRPALAERVLERIIRYFFTKLHFCWSDSLPWQLAQWQPVCNRLCVHSLHRTCAALFHTIMMWAHVSKQLCMYVIIRWDLCLYLSSPTIFRHHGAWKRINASLLQTCGRGIQRSRQIIFGAEWFGMVSIYKEHICGMLLMDVCGTSMCHSKLMNDINVSLQTWNGFDNWFDRPLHNKDYKYSTLPSNSHLSFQIRTLFVHHCCVTAMCLTPKQYKSCTHLLDTDNKEELILSRWRSRFMSTAQFTQQKGEPQLCD